MVELSDADYANIQQLTAYNQQIQAQKNLKPYETETIQYLRELTTVDAGVPTHIKSMLWSFTNKVHQLTNITRQEADEMINEAELILDYLDLFTSRRYKDGVWLINLKQALLNFTSAINRSVEGFERKRQSTTTTEGSFNMTPIKPPARKLI